MGENNDSTSCSISRLDFAKHSKDADGWLVADDGSPLAASSFESRSMVT